MDPKHFNNKTAIYAPFGKSGVLIISLVFFDTFDGILNLYIVNKMKRNDTLSIHAKRINCKLIQFWLPIVQFYLEISLYSHLYMSIINVEKDSHIKAIVLSIVRTTIF